MKEIPNPGILVSVNHCYERSCNLEVFDVSQKGNVKKLYFSEEVRGSIIFH